MKTKVIAFVLSAITVTASAAGARPTDAQLDMAFAKADADKNGTLNLAEAIKFGIMDVAFEKANPDKDGSLDKGEFLAAITYQFERANPDKDGTLDRQEAAKAGITSKKVFEGANPDNDGTLDLSEYVQALMLKAK